MESYLEEENFGVVKGNNSSDEALRRWRKLSSFTANISNPKRRFRFTANLNKRAEALAIKHANHEKLRVAVLVSKAALDYIKGLTPEEVKATWFQICTDELGSIFQCRTGPNPHLISLQRLKDITNNFNDDLILGSGGFGMVYKGVVQEGRSVAVKKLVVSTPKSHNQFENEVDLLTKLEHPNIVRLVGHCYDTQLLHMPFEGKMVVAESTARFLCLECMPNGSLDKYISDASSGLDWRNRCKIIEGISFGLQYLHEEANGPIIHLDLKPANILLGENLVPKITDFGLSRLFDQLSMHTAIASGTLGYMAVEYQQRGIITPMADIFSLGVIILEVITGHRDYPYDIRTDSKDFIKRELQKWKNRLQKEPSLETDCQQIERYIQIGLICVNPERRKRPTMNKIINMLQGLESLNSYITNEGSGSPFVLLPRGVNVRILATQAFNLFGLRFCFWLVCVCACVCVTYLKFC